jgi:hypothetical protein
VKTPKTPDAENNPPTSPTIIAFDDEADKLSSLTAPPTDDAASRRKTVQDADEEASVPLPTEEAAQPKSSDPPKTRKPSDDISLHQLEFNDKSAPTIPRRPSPVARIGAMHKTADEMKDMAGHLHTEPPPARGLRVTVASVPAPSEPPQGEVLPAGLPNEEPSPVPPAEDNQPPTADDAAGGPVPLVPLSPLKPADRRPSPLPVPKDNEVEEEEAATNRHRHSEDGKSLVPMPARTNTGQDFSATVSDGKPAAPGVAERKATRSWVPSALTLALIGCGVFLLALMGGIGVLTVHLQSTAPVKIPVEPVIAVPGTVENGPPVVKAPPEPPVDKPAETVEPPKINLPKVPLELVTPSSAFAVLKSYEIGGGQNCVVATLSGVDATKNGTEEITVCGVGVLAKDNVITVNAGELAPGSIVDEIRKQPEGEVQEIQLLGATVYCPTVQGQTACMRK